MVSSLHQAQPTCEVIYVAQPWQSTITITNDDIMNAELSFCYNLSSGEGLKLHMSWLHHYSYVLF